jgi:Tfp pilus assembly protein PilZ
MSLSKIKFQKYNIYMTKLFNLILTLNPEEQRFLLKKVENLILKEKRSSARKVCRIPVRYFYNERIYKNFIVNISRDGCFIEAQKPLPIGEKFLMNIQLDGDAESIKIKGEVANANRMGMGIEFVKVSSNLLEKLGNLLYNIN